MASMPPTMGSATLSNQAFLTDFHDCTLPLSMFRHGDHLRFAWLTLHQHPFAPALQLVRAGIQRFAAHHGAAHIFHETLTQAWVHLLATHSEPTFPIFLATHGHRLNATLLHRFWTPGLLQSTAARQHWVAPNLAPLPARLR